MPPASQPTRDASLVIDRATHTIRLTRTFDAPCADVFEAWTRPEHVACWWDAAGERLEVCEIDLRPGGAFSFVSRGHQHMPFAGRYIEIAPPHRLTFETMGATGRVTLQESAGGTLM